MPVSPHLYRYGRAHFVQWTIRALFHAFTPVFAQPEGLGPDHRGPVNTSCDQRKPFGIGLSLLPGLLLLFRSPATDADAANLLADVDAWRRDFLVLAQIDPFRPALDETHFSRACFEEGSMAFFLRGKEAWGQFSSD